MFIVYTVYRFMNFRYYFRPHHYIYIRPPPNHRSVRSVYTGRRAPIITLRWPWQLALDIRSSPFAIAHSWFLLISHQTLFFVCTLTGHQSITNILILQTIFRWTVKYIHTYTLNLQSIIVNNCFKLIYWSFISHFIIKYIPSLFQPCFLLLGHYRRQWVQFRPPYSVQSPNVY